MSDRMRLLQAIGQIAEDDLLDTEIALGLADGWPVAVIHRRKVLRTLLIAAVLSAFFVAAAFAAGLFGLRDRLVPGQNPRERLDLTPDHEASETGGAATQSGYLPAYGLRNSPEALANAEYLDMFLQYMTQGNREDEDAAVELPIDDAELEKIESIYFVFDREMTEKLLQIADKYGLKLYTRMIFPRSLEEFYALAGTEPFFLPDGADGSMTCNYIFEDGAFLCEGDLDIAGDNGNEDKGIRYSLTRGMPGYLYPFLRYVEEPGAYDEWAYVTSRGASVSIAWRSGQPIPTPAGEDTEDSFDHVYIFYEENQRSISLNCSAYDGMSVERAQAIADCFDFSAACQGQPHILPAMEAGPGGDFPIEQLAQSVEYLAWGEFTGWFEVQTGEGEYTGVFPFGQKAIDEVAERIAERDHLTLPRAVTVLEETETTPEERLQTISLDPFYADAEPGTLYAYDNGCFQLQFSTGGIDFALNYIQKGSYYPLFHPLIWLDLPFWNHDAACGSTVRIFSDAADAQSRDYILHETEKGYVVVWTSGGANSPSALEAAADCIDFTAFE